MYSRQRTSVPRCTAGRGRQYLGVQQAEDIKHRQLKKQTSAEYTNRVRKILKSKLNGGNIIQAINNWAVPVIRYTAGIVDWTIAELEDLDRKTRKLMTAHRTLHPQSDIDRLYFPRRIGEEDSCRSDRQ